MIQIDTQNSCYEIDMANMRIRRLRGIDELLTARFEQDGLWRPYEAIQSLATKKPYPVPGEPLLVCWAHKEDLRDNTITSPVRRVISVSDAPH